MHLPLTVRALAACGLLCLLGLSSAASAPLPEVDFDQRGPVATSEGHATLSWAARESGGPARTFELQYSDRSDFDTARTWYRGPDRASFVSGLPEGETWFRVRALEDELAGPFSEPIAVEVRYASDAVVARLMALGAVVFLATVATVVIGHRRRHVPTR
jgi:hypothetical protein